MFCDKCGNFLQEEARFCDKCGNFIENETSVLNVTSEGKNDNGYYASLILSAFVMVMSLFQKWIEIPFFDEKIGFSIFQVFEAIEYIDASIFFYILMGALMIIVLVAVLIFGLHIFQTLKNHTLSKLSIVASFMYCLVVVVGFIVLIFANLTIQRGSFGLFEHVLSFSFWVYFTSVVAIVNIVVTSKSFSKK